MKKNKVICFIFSLFWVLNFTACSGNGGDPSLISNMYGTDSSAELVVQWHNFSANRQKLQIVEYSGSFSSPLKEINVKGTEFSSTGENGEFEQRFIFRAYVDGLAPATLYKYRVGSAGYWSQEYTHLTSGGENKNFSFTVAADPQSLDAAGMRVTFNAAITHDTDTRFFLIAGDITDEIAKRPQEIVNYTNVAEEFNISRPVAATQGNHDTYGISGNNQYRFNYHDDGCGTIFNAFVAFPRNGHLTDEKKALSYYFYYNDVLIVMLNSMVADNARDHAAQANWLREILEADKSAKKSKYTIVVSHVGPFSGRSVDRYFAKPMRDAYGQILSDYDVDIFFSGHDHIYTRSNPIKLSGTNIGYTSVNPGPTDKGTVFSIVSSTGPKFYALDSGTAQNPEIGVPYIYPVITKTIPEQQPGIFVNVKVTDEKLSVTAVRADGHIVDSYEVPAKR